MKYLLVLFSTVLINNTVYCQSPIQIYWQINNAHYANKELTDLPKKLIKAISNNQLTSYNFDSTIQIDKKYLIEKLEPIAPKCFLNKEEIAIMIKYHDYSVMEYIITAKSADDLNEMLSRGEDISKHFELIKRSPLDVGCLSFEINEEIIRLDTINNIQKGVIRYINITMPTFNNNDVNPVFLCRIRYSDFLKLDWKENQRIEQRAFYIDSKKDDLIIEDNGNVYKLSSYVNNPSWNINDTVFKYFSINLIIKN